jgi:hypothetical protein
LIKYVKGILFLTASLLTLSGTHLINPTTAQEDSMTGNTTGNTTESTIGNNTESIEDENIQSGIISRKGA